MAESQQSTSSLVALGVAGDVSLEILEDSQGNLELVCDIGRFGIRVPLDDVASLQALRAFFLDTLRTRRYLDVEVEPGRWASSDAPAHHLGSSEGLAVVLRKDSKYDDRYFLLVGESLRFTPSVDQTDHFVQALASLLEDID
jgi:hypothetical protein